MHEKKNRILAAILLGIFAIIILLIAFLSPGIGGEGDSFTHYFIARHAASDPKWLLDLWGRPLFTLLATPFAQFGYSGMKIFSILMALITAWLGYLMADKMKFQHPWLAIPFIILTPLYFNQIFSPPVSYTHLRAHETVLDLVCRLLLEKKNNNHTNINILLHINK